MSAPLVDPDFAGPHYFGDTADDDPTVIDSQIQSVNAPATPEVERIDNTPLERPKPIGRLLTGTVSLSLLDGVASPIMILPADRNRKSVTVSVFSTAADPTAFIEYVQLADENGKCQNKIGAYVLRHGKDPLTLTFTGALWVIPASTITAAIELTYVAETE